MKRKFLLGCMTFLILVIVSLVFTVYYFFYSMNRLPEGEYLSQTNSPNMTYTIEFYLVNGGATTDFSIRGELVTAETNERENIYWEYRREDVKAVWTDEHTVVINGHKLDVRKDKYDWRKEMN
ncbi:hypothetical protein CBW65_02680 [Tumebacillus avium]|uniref:DUF5412 domain-containing protein n=1 Tax=Tumebacillus avium TaxID=1903704 RepID=A0A1Y0IIF3_9BACL|nr:DUF5412 domain-containing protein [Tumebacillus avium]ARU60080.1 hypothetical protein CBW65_02680 [Tumebacillus avium]